jgi:large subunit ribosomal protein L31e
MADEKVYMVNLRDAFEKPRGKRSPKAIGIIRAFIARHMKVGEENIRVSNKLNAIVWARGIQKPPRRVKVKAAKKDNIVFVYHIDEKIEQPKPAEKKKGEKAEAKKEEKKEDKKFENKEELKREETKKEERAEKKQESAEKAHTREESHGQKGR